MITTSDPLEFIPRGRKVIKNHPGPANDEEEQSINELPVELVLLRRLENVKISLDEKRPVEHYRLREMPINIAYAEGHLSEEDDNLTVPELPMPYLNKEEELYVSDNTAVWTWDIAVAYDEGSNEACPQISYTCDTPIRFAFFCPSRFVRPNTAPAGKCESYNRTAVCLIDNDTIHVFCDDGETYKAMLLCPIASVWMMPNGIMLERCFADQKPIPMYADGPNWPRLFTLTFTLDEMKPALLAMGDNVSIVTEADTRMVFSSDEVQLVLLYSEKLAKHIICRLRLASEADLEAVRATYVSVFDGYDDSDDEQNETQPSATYQPPTNQTNLKHMRTFDIDSTNMTHSSIGASVGGGGGGNAHASANVLAGPSMKACYENIIKSTKVPKDDMPKVLDTGDLENLYDDPSFCLEHIWTDKGDSITGPGGVSTPLWSATNGEMASTAFLHTDLVGNRYLCYLQARACRLTLVQYKESDLSIVDCRSVPARSAIALSRLNMLVLLDLGGRLVLYSGPIAVGILHVAGLQSTISSCFRTPQHIQSVVELPTHPKRSTLLPNITPSEGKFEEELHMLSPIRPSAAGVSAVPSSSDSSPIRDLLDATGTRFTLMLGNGRLVRVTMAPVAQSRLVVSCLDVLKTILPKTTANEFIMRWYGTRNVPGSQTGFSADREWKMFHELLLTVMGRPSSSGRGDGGGGSLLQPRVRRTHDEGDGPDVEPKKRRRAEERTNAWNYVMQENQERKEGAVDEEEEEDIQQLSVAPRLYQPREPYSLYPHIASIMEALHLLYEDLKMDLCRASDLPRLGDFLYQLAKDGKLRPYQMHYFLDFPVLLDRHRYDKVYTIPDGLETLASAKPVNVFRYVKHVLEDSDQASHPFPYRENINARSCDVIALIAYIYRARHQQNWAKIRPGSIVCEIKTSARALLLPANDMKKANANSFRIAGETVLTFLADRGYTRGWIDCLPIGMRFIIMQCLEQCREYLVHGQRSAFYELLMRPELREHEHGTDTIPQKVLPQKELPEDVKQSKPNVPHTVVDAAIAENYKNQPKLEPVVGGISEFMEWISDSSDMESTCTAVAISMGVGIAGVGSAAGVSSSNTAATGSGNKDDPSRMAQRDADGMGGLDEEVLQILFPDDKRMDIVRRFLDSSRRVKVSLPKSAVVPEHQLQEEQERRLYAILLRTMALAVGRGMFTAASYLPAQTQIVPIPRLCLTGRDTRGVTIEIQQIEVPPNMTLWPAFHNGVAAGLRVCPGMPHLSSSWITHNRPTAGGRSTTGCGPPPPPPPGADRATEHGGFLLALGLTGHLRELSHYCTYDYMVNSDEMVRLGLLLGLSAAYRGSADPTITRLLAVHVEALLPPTAVELDVVQNLQVAAVLGVGLLYQGTAKRHIAEVLLNEIGRPPGPEMENSVERESYALTAGLALGLVTLGRGNEMLGDLTIPEQLFHYMTGGYRRPLMGAQREKYRLPSFQIKEDPEVYTSVTAPGAILALGLMYFATENETISNWLDPPSNNYMLGFVRPDLQLLRTIARHLVHWNRIKPNRTWIFQSVQAELSKAMFLHRPDEEDEEPSACRVIGARPMSRRAERQLYSQAYYATVSGSILAIGLRYAGTADESAVDTIESYLQIFLEQTKHLGQTPPPSATSLPRLVGYQALENCTLMALLALSLVLAGTGSLSVLRYIRMLRARTRAPYVTYGSHMAVHMALGFLYLGGGRYTLSRSPSAIAALICAIFPKFPTCSNDNRYHLQAFRHLYVFAMEPRIFLPRNIETGRLCVCYIRYAMRDAKNSVVERLAPCLLPEMDTLEWVELSDKNFWNFRFDRDRNWHLLENMMKKNGRVAVKQHMGCLSSQEDPAQILTNQLSPLGAKENRQWNFKPEILLKLTCQIEVLNIYMKLLIPPETESFITPLDRHQRTEYEIFSTAHRSRHVSDGVMQDRLHAMPIFNSLFQMLNDTVFGMSSTGSIDVWQMCLVKLALMCFIRTHQKPSSRLLVYPELIRAIIESIHGRADIMRNRYYPFVRQYLLGVYSTDLFEQHLPRSLLPWNGNDEQDSEQQRLYHLTNLTKLVVMDDLPYCPIVMMYDNDESCVDQLLEMLRNDNTCNIVYWMLETVCREW
uniref:Uncharacterized protein n=1 Tax=Anopheles farauti TaxID=69004 RepID=A0A182QAH1_9DIPT